MPYTFDKSSSDFIGAQLIQFEGYAGQLSKLFVPRPWKKHLLGFQFDSVIGSEKDIRYFFPVRACFRKLLTLRDFDSPREINRLSSITDDSLLISRGKLNPAERDA
jgi:hypothetical protein